MWRRFLVSGVAALLAAFIVLVQGPAQQLSGFSAADAQPVTIGRVCTYNSDCPSPFFCISGRCRVQCRVDRDCPAEGLICRDEMWIDGRFMRRRPVDQRIWLLRDGESTSNIAGVCFDPRYARSWNNDDAGYHDHDPLSQTCRSDSECAEPLRCNRTIGSCVPQCRADADCGAGQQCRVERWTTDRSAGQSTRFMELLPIGAQPRFEADGSESGDWGVCYSVGGGPVREARGRPPIVIAAPPLVAPGVLRPTLPSVRPGTPQPQNGAAPQLPQPQPLSGLIENDTDRPGADIARHVLPNADPAACAGLCAGTDNCRAWTMVRPGFQGANAVCYLKDRAPARSSNRCCVSGVR
jgi:Cys-rich repeat protein